MSYLHTAIGILIWMAIHGSPYTECLTGIRFRAFRRHTVTDYFVCTCKDVTGEVCCFFCGGRLSRWQANDDPMTKHRDLYPTCGFVRLMMDDQSDTTLLSQSSEQVRTI